MNAKAVSESAGGFGDTDDTWLINGRKSRRRECRWLMVDQMGMISRGSKRPMVCAGHKRNAPSARFHSSREHIRLICFKLIRIKDAESNLGLTLDLNALKRENKSA